MKTKNVTEKNMKVCLVGSSGGHLTHLYMLKPFWKDKNRFWVTFDKEDARSLLEGEKVYPCYFPTNRSIKALIKNTKIAWDVLHKEKPDLIISCGAAVAVPFFYIGKMMGAKVVYIEVFDRIDKPTMTGKMVYPIVDKFVVQWEEQKKVYPKAVNLGSMPLLGITDEMNYNPTLDCLVIGSDEVFNCIQKNSNVGYSLELFGKDNHAKRLLTYAASFGNTTLEKLEKYKKADEVGVLLKKFDAISVRDANSGAIVEQLTEKKPVYNLDPVLTYDYMNCCDKIPQLRADEKYLILYAYAGRISNEEADWIAAYAKKKNLKIYAIGGIQKCADRFVDCSPFEVLAYFRNAEEVITDTFHGSIFSVITHRPFTTLIRKSVGNSYGNEEKLSDLLERLDLADRMTAKVEDAENINEETIDYAKVDELLKAHREVAKEYLRSNLEG